METKCIIHDLHEEIRHLPDPIRWYHFLIAPFKFWNLLRYKSRTLQNIYDKCGLSKEVQAVLCANAGDFLLPPEKLSILVYTALIAGYNAGAFYPTKHFKHYTESVAQFITEHEGCHIYYETEVNKININGNAVENVETKDGKTFTAKNIICNMDPQRASFMIDRDKFQKKYLPALSYEYSDSSLTIYLGLKDIDLRKYGFGKHNTWHLMQWDMNKTWKEQSEDNFKNPWFFISTPTLLTEASGNAPAGCQIMEIATLVNYNSLKELQKKSYGEYRKKKMEIADRLLDLVEEKYVPDLRKHIAVKVVGSPITNEDFILAPKGNAYGSSLTPQNCGAKRLKFKTPWNNFYWCNASSGFPSFCGTIATGTTLYMHLTGDRFYDSSKAPPPNEKQQTDLSNRQLTETENRP